MAEKSPTTPLLITCQIGGIETRFGRTGKTARLRKQTGPAVIAQPYRMTAEAAAGHSPASRSSNRS